MKDLLKTEFLLYAAIEGQSEEYKKLDLITLREGPGKHQIYLEEFGRFFTEYFPNDILYQLAQVIEGTPLEAYRVAGTNVTDDDGLVHPSAEHSAMTPEGLVLHGVGIWENIRVAPHPEGGDALWGTAVMNETTAASNVRETVRLALERGSQFVPAPSINGYMLWEPVIEGENAYLMARKVVNLRSTEFVNRPAAGGRLYAVVEGTRMNLLAMLKGYCAAHGIAHNAEATSVAEFLQNVEQDEVLTKVSGMYESDESGALSALAGAFEVVGKADDEGTVEKKAQPSVATPSKTTMPKQAPKAEPNQPGAAVEEPMKEVSLDLDTSEINVNLGGVPEMLGQVSEGLRAMQQQNVQLSKGMEQRFGAFDEQMKLVNQYIAAQQSRETKAVLLSAVQESQLPKHRKNFWMAQVESGKIQKLAVLKAFIDDDAQAEGNFQAQMMEGIDAAELPVSVRNLFSVEAPQEDKNYLRAKLLFGAPLTEGEQSMVNAAGLRGFIDVKQMYNTLVPGDFEQGMLTGMAYGGPGGGQPQKYYAWKNELLGMQTRQSIAGGTEVVRRGDFTGILLDVVRQMGLARWDMQQLDAFDICHVGPGFQDFEASNLVITGTAPDMGTWNNLTGFPNIETGARKKVETAANVLGGILRWSWDVILNDRNGSALNIIQTDVDNSIDATYRTIVRAIINALMGWTSTGINTATPDSDGVLYQASVPGGVRQNYFNADGRSYATMVELLSLMQNQVDFVKAGETAQPLIMLPGIFVCVTTFATTALQFFTMEYKPGTTDANELGVAQTPKVIGVHRNFLHNRDDFTAMLPNATMQPVIELQYFMNRKKPSLVWQTNPEIGRTFENGEIACRLDMPVRVTLARPKGAFAAFTA